MKGSKRTRRDHLVPLPDRAIELLHEVGARDAGPDQFVFQGKAGQQFQVKDSVVSAIGRFIFSKLIRT